MNLHEDAKSANEEQSQKMSDPTTKIAAPAVITEVIDEGEELKDCG